MKRLNRKNEKLADAAERASVAAGWIGAAPYPGELLREAWIRFLWHQFHDDLTGTSIPQAYEYSWNDEALSANQFEGILEDSVGAVSMALETDVRESLSSSTTRCPFRERMSSRPSSSSRGRAESRPRPRSRRPRSSGTARRHIRRRRGPAGGRQGPVPRVRAVRRFGVYEVQSAETTGPAVAAAAAGFRPRPRGWRTGATV